MPDKDRRRAGWACAERIRAAADARAGNPWPTDSSQTYDFARARANAGISQEKNRPTYRKGPKA